MGTIQLDSTKWNKLSIEIYSVQVKAVQSAAQQLEEYSVQITFYNTTSDDDDASTAGKDDNTELCTIWSTSNLPGALTWLANQNIPEINLTISGLKDFQKDAEKFVKLLKPKALTLICTLSCEYLKTKTTAATASAKIKQQLASCSKYKVEFIDLKPAEACELIPLLRKANLETILKCNDLSFKTANFIFENADVNQEDILVHESKELASLYMADCLPVIELHELSSRGISLIVTFNERKFVPWISVAGVATLALAQTIAGGALICTGFGATVGMGLITEGMADFMTAQRIYSTREFNWSSYGIQKSVSVAISIASAGLSSLKDSAKGAKMIVEGAAKETVEQAGTKVILSGKNLSQVVASTGKSLKSLATKDIAVNIGVTGARIGLKAIADTLVEFCFENVRENIIQEVSQSVNIELGSPRFRGILTFYWTIEREYLKPKIQNIVSMTLNPASSFWTQAWNSVGYPLTNHLLSSPQYLGSTMHVIGMLAGAISGMKEIATVVRRVSDEIHTQLKESKPTLEQVIQKRCQFNEKLAKIIVSHVQANDASYDHLHFAMSKELIKGMKPELNKDEQKILLSTF